MDEAQNLEDLESNLKEAYNNYIDAMVDYLNQVKSSSNLQINNADKYLLDNHISRGLRDSLEIVRAGDTNKLLEKKL